MAGLTLALHCMFTAALWNDLINAMHSYSSVRETDPRQANSHFLLHCSPSGFAYSQYIKAWGGHRHPPVES